MNLIAEDPQPEKPIMDSDDEATLADALEGKEIDESEEKLKRRTRRKKKQPKARTILPRR